MEERQNRSQLQWFDQYRASKTALFWACAGSAVLTLAVGFFWGGWATMPVSMMAAPATPVDTGDHRKAAGLCAEELAKQEIPAAGRAEQINDGTTVAQ